MLQEAGRMDRAVQVLEAAVGMNAQDLEARSRLGAAYAQMGRIADAERVFRAVLDEDPQSAEALTNLGVCICGPAGARRRLPRCGEPSPPIPRHRRAQHAGRRLRAIRRSSSAWTSGGGRRLRPDDPDILYNLGTALLKLNRPAEARPVLERFVAGAPPRYAADVARVRR